MKTSTREVFLAFLQQGLSAFGGPIAHLGYFRDEFVVRRRWLDEQAYADLVALCQFLPGPASSQVGLAIGLRQAGYRGALAAWAGFTLPSAILLILFALAIDHLALPGGLIQGLKLLAVAVVAQAAWSMARSLCPDGPRQLMMLLAAGVLIAWPGIAVQLVVIATAACVGHFYLAQPQATANTPLTTALPRRHGVIWLAIFFILLFGLPALHAIFPGQALALIDACYRAGALVFGGGHVVLPLLQAEVVAPGWVSAEQFLAGYGIAQAVPGPLFTFAAFLGAAAAPAPNGWSGGFLALLAIFLPAFLLVAGTLPFWDRLRADARARGALSGVNAGVVGLLLAAFYDPVLRSSIHAPVDVLIAGGALLLLTRGRQAPWRVVPLCALAGWLFA